MNRLDRERRREIFRRNLPRPGERDFRQDDGSEYTEEEVTFIRAMEEWMRRTRCKFPRFTDVLRVAKSLGYRKA